MTTTTNSHLTQQLEHLPLSIFRPKEYFFSLLKNNVRADGRNLSTMRDLQIERLPINRKTVVLQASQAKESFSWALGSSQVRLGETLVLCVVSGVIETSSAKQGNLECLIAMNHFYPFMKGELIAEKPPVAVELEQFLQETLVRGKIIDLRELILLEEEASLTLQLQLTVLSQNGNLRDALYYAALTALHEVILPEITILPPVLSDGIKNTVEPTQITLSYAGNRRLTLISAIPLTLGLFNCSDTISSHPLSFLYLDPTEREEQQSDGLMSLLYHPVEEVFYYLSLSSNGLIKSQLLQILSEQKELLKALHQRFLER